MKSLVEYAQTYGVDIANNYMEPYSAYAIGPLYAHINFPNGYRAFILKKKVAIHSLWFEYIDVVVFDWNGNIPFNALYGICEDNYLPCKNEAELIGTLETIRKLKANRKVLQ